MQSLWLENTLFTDLEPVTVKTNLEEVGIMLCDIDISEAGILFENIPKFRFSLLAALEEKQTY